MSRKSSDGNIVASFGADLCLSGFTSIPNLLLTHYPQLGLTDFEVLVLIQIMGLRQKGVQSAPTALTLSKYMNADQGQIQDCISRLIDKKFLVIKHYFHEEEGNLTEYYCFDVLFGELSGIWAMEKQQLLLKTQRMVENKYSKSLKKIYNAFEKEFGRLLSPTEAQQITIWVEEHKINPELVLEALRRAGLRGVLNFRYIDKILLDWQKRKLDTLKDLLAQEENQSGWDKTKGNGKLKAKQGKAESGTGEDDDEFTLLYLS
ncbi:MAG: DnaD domain protein [Clostridia bacterium]|nr:DnaD domain protein [Clostridia bacterium]